MPNRKKIALAFPILLLAYAANGQKLSTPGLKPVWTLDLRQNPEYAARMERRRDYRLPRLPRPRLAFVGSETIAISFHDERWEDFPPDHLQDFHFRTIFVNASTGKLEDRSLAWPTPDDDSALLPMRDGGFVVVAGKQILRYSPDFKLEVQSSVPADPGNDDVEEFGYYPQSTVLWQKTHWYAREDPQQEVIILCHEAHGTSYFWLDGKTFRILGSVKNLKGWPNWHSGSKDAVIVSVDPQSIISERNGQFHPFCPYYTGDNTYFVGEDRLFGGFTRNQRYFFALMTRDCRIVKRMKLPAGYGWDVAAESASGSRVALTDRIFGRLNIRVWNLNPPEEIMKLLVHRRDTKSPVDIGFGDSAEALSPDGKYLAVLVDFTLAVYAISP